jgi:hypothetical protein
LRGGGRGDCEHGDEEWRELDLHDVFVHFAGVAPGRTSISCQKLVQLRKLPAVKRPMAIMTPSASYLLARFQSDMEPLRVVCNLLIRMASIQA